MLKLPPATEFNKRIPKQKFYEHASLAPEIKLAFKESIKNIWWTHKLSEATIALEAGKSVKELEILKIRLTAPDLAEGVLRAIDRAIPDYHILFILEHEGRTQAAIGYKEAGGKVKTYYRTPWRDDLPLKIEGLTLDDVYEGLLRQIAGDALPKGEGETLKQSAARAEEIAKLKKEADRLRAKMRKEKQLNRQMIINAELKGIKNKLEGLLNG